MNFPKKLEIKTKNESLQGQLYSQTRLTSKNYLTTINMTRLDQLILTIFNNLLEQAANLNNLTDGKSGQNTNKGSTKAKITHVIVSITHGVGQKVKYLINKPLIAFIVIFVFLTVMALICALKRKVRKMITPLDQEDSKNSGILDEDNMDEFNRKDSFIGGMLSSQDQNESYFRPSDNLEDSIYVENFGPRMTKNHKLSNEVNVSGEKDVTTSNFDTFSKIDSDGIKSKFSSGWFPSADNKA